MTPPTVKSCQYGLRTPKANPKVEAGTNATKLTTRIQRTPTYERTNAYQVTFPPQVRDLASCCRERRSCITGESLIRDSCSIASLIDITLSTLLLTALREMQLCCRAYDAGKCQSRKVGLTSQIFVFTDGSFANNKDLSSQIGFVIIIANETAQSTDSFSIRGNILHWSSTKCKRVTRSVLASEIYGLTSGFDLAFVIKQTVNTIAQRLDLKQIPLVICTDSYSLYECLVKLGTTTEKRLMIDIMALRQAYESRDIAEIRWVNGADNPADAMTKASPNSALTQFISDNQLNVRVEGFEILVSIFQPHPALEMRPMMAVGRELQSEHTIQHSDASW
ncbi:polyprotein [Hirsutella rhossiliensis]